jgi:hypothetical protein
MAEKIKLFEADIDVEGILKKSKELAEETSRLKLEQQKLKNTVGETSEAFLINDANLKKVSAELRLNQKQVSNLAESNGKLLNVNQKLTNSLNKEITTISEAAKNNSELKKIRNELNLTKEKDLVLLAQLNTRLDQNTEFIKTNVSGLEKQKIAIGSYTESIRDAVFHGGNLKASLKAAGQGFLGLAKSALTFLATPLGLVLGAIGVAFLLVKNAMNRSEEATNKITKVFSVFGGIINKLLKALEPLGEFLIDVIVDAFELVGEAAEATLSIVSGALDLLGFESAAEAVDSFSSSMKEGVKQAQALSDAEAKLTIAQRESRKIQLDYQKDAEKFRQIRDNENLSIKERIKANEDLGAVLEKQLSDELKIAELALEVANLRIEAEGETAEALDNQEEALTNISDIQERITGQQSEQLTNRVSLQKEAADKAKEIANKAIAEQQALLNKFIESQGIRKKSFEDQLKFEQEIYEKEKIILEANLKNRNITQTEYDSQLLALQNELLKSKNNLTQEQFQRELDLFVQKNQSKIDNEVYFSEQSLGIEQQRLNDIADKQRLFAKQQLTAGTINQQEYNDSINQINEENRLKLEEAQLLRDQAQSEKDLIDSENNKIIEEEKFQNDLAIKYERLEAQRLVEVEAAEKKGNDITLVNKKYAAFKKNIDKEVEDFKVSQSQASLDAVKSLLGEETNLGKLAGIVSIVNDTVTQSTKAFNQAAVFASNPITAPLAINANIQGGLIIAKGAAQAGKLVNPKFKDGGAFTIGGKPHSQGGTTFVGDDGSSFEAEKDETMFILKKETKSSLAPLLSRLNQKYGGVPLSSSSAYLQSGGQVLRGVKAQVQGTDYTQMTRAIEKAVMAGSEAGSRMGSMQGSMEGSSRGTYSGIKDREDYLSIEAGANF